MIWLTWLNYKHIPIWFIFPDDDGIENSVEHVKAVQLCGAINCCPTPKQKFARNKDNSGLYAVLNLV